jgi:5-methylcytosine-specific restriction endonuclease McrA
MKQIYDKTYQDAYRAKRRDYLREWARQYRLDNPELISEQRRLNYKKTKDKRLSDRRAWGKANRGAINAINKRIKHGKRNRTPKWLNKSQLLEIKQFYLDACYLTNYTKTEVHVDHIIPLNGKLVSGLHVPWNLQLLPRQENLKKGNKIVGLRVVL